MTSLLVLGWLVVAHLVADFLLQTDELAAEKYGGGRPAARALLLHSLVVAICLVPFVVAFEGRGLAALVAIAVLHGIVDLAKARLTRRVEAGALELARGVHEPAARPATLGTGWTPLPAVLFVVDQAAHLVVIVSAWWLLLRDAPLGAAFVEVVNRLTSGASPADVHRLAVATIVGTSLLIVNVRAASFFVAILLRPEPALSASTPRAVAVPPAAQPAATAYRVRLGPISGSIEPQVPAPVPAAPRTATPGRVGAAIGVVERLVIVMLMLSGAQLAIGLVIAAKTLARFKQLDDREFAEYYLLGTLASVGVAVGSAIAAGAVIGVL